jgi:hypothetical protein
MHFRRGHEGWLMGFSAQVSVDVVSIRSPHGIAATDSDLGAAVSIS